MNGLVVLAACVCASSAQLLGVPARAFAAPVHQQTHQFHAQDEFGQFTFGYAGGPSARTESRDAYGVTRGSYQLVDANNILQTVHYVADPINGFQVSGTNLPAAPVAPAVTPLVAPVFTAVGPAPVQDTPEVVAAKAEHAAAHAAAKAAAGAERKRRSAQLIAAPTAYAGYPAAGLPLTYAAAGLPAAPIAPAALPYNAVSAPGAAREAVLTTIKLNPGHATFYRVD